MAPYLGFHIEIGIETSGAMGLSVRKGTGSW